MAHSIDGRQMIQSVDLGVLRQDSEGSTASPPAHTARRLPEEDGMASK